MSLITQFSRLSNVLGSFKNVLQGRKLWHSPVSVCTYTRKSAEQRLGIEKPKRPLTPFFKFMSQMRPALLAKNPGITSKEAIAWSSKHWQELDLETKLQMKKEYEKDLEDYKKIKVMYESTLTDHQKDEIKRVKDEMAAAKDKRKLKAEYKELDRPRKPMSSYLIFAQSKKSAMKSNNLKEYQAVVKDAWLKLPANEKAKFEKQAQDLMDKYKKDIEAWELKMISIGRSDLVRAKPTLRVKAKTEKSKKEQ